MSFSLFFRSLALYFALVLAAYAFLPGAGADFLIKASALALGCSLATPIAYPYLRGVRKGDAVEVESAAFDSAPLFVRLFMRPGSGTALSAGRTGTGIEVLFGDGSRRRCVIIGYEGFFKPARVKLLEREVIDSSSVTIV